MLKPSFSKVGIKPEELFPPPRKLIFVSSQSDVSIGKNSLTNSTLTFLSVTDKVSLSSALPGDILTISFTPMECSLTTLVGIARPTCVAPSWLKIKLSIKAKLASRLSISSLIM